MDERPLCIDLFCGLGGWAEGFLREGYRVVGFDNDPRFAEPYRKAGGEFVLQDVRTLDGRRFQDATCIVASPPCNEFTRLRFLRRDPPPPDMACVNAVWRIREESGVPTVLENVEGARRYIGLTTVHRGPWWLWGDVPLLNGGALPPKEGGIPRASNPWLVGRSGGPAFLPDGSRPRLQAWGRRGKASVRAKIPLPLARVIARGFRYMAPLAPSGNGDARGHGGDP